MASKNYAAKGTKIQMGNGASPEVFTTIAQVVDISGPALKDDVLDVTNHGSTGGWKEFIGGLKEGGSITLKLNYDPAETTHDASTGFLADFKNSTVRNYKLIFPDTGNTTWNLTGIVEHATPKAPVAGKLEQDVSIRVTGQPTLV